ncbi:hypothetical protein [Leptolyngbya sp. FACHB-17]|uniref:hypothetical protein n=1 Tax=unclassified Leptolyngbya TaxID=2650499 RepID=UPI0016803E7E|nr:hypothetical protein [Leptolyngbya sp. FACHB-17]MBD2078794.1 hypothetical protein [Leptolyngbya sp. FACHB-17]
MTAFVTGMSIVGQQTQLQAIKDGQIDQTTRNQTRQIEAKGEIAKTYQKAGIGQPVRNFIILNGTQQNVIDLASRNAQVLINSMVEGEPLTLLDKHNNVIGSFDGKQVCNIKKDCIQIAR